MYQATIEDAIAAADVGMSRALARAEHAVPSWGEIALDFLDAYARKNQEFPGWMVVKASELDRAFPEPPNPKAWGPIVKRAVKVGLIEYARPGKDPNRHCNPIPIWRSRVYGQ